MHKLQSTLIISSVCCVLFTSITQAQQLATWSQFRTYQYIHNPAVVDIFELANDDHRLDIDLSYRAQWTGYEDAPRTAILGGQYTNTHQNMSFGGYIINDRFGPTDYNQIGIHYAYQIKFERAESNFLSIGLSASASQFRIENSKLDVIDPSDDLIATDDQSAFSPNITFGIYYQKKLGGYSSGGTYLLGGLSAEQIIPSDVNFTSGANLKREPIFHAFGGVHFFYDGRGYDFVEPVVRVRKGINTPLHVDLGFKMTFQEEKFWIGGAVGSDFQVHLQFGLLLFEKWGIGYSGSFFLNPQLGEPAGLSHELVMSYRGWL